ncbi:hypothetical protein WNZ15_01890 [Roseibium sp. AS2]|uniref:hypothetical protein n=1 Tax=Roseibium sp. AS2 TaxID=3135781 RepID=UPI00317100BA
MYRIIAGLLFLLWATISYAQNQTSYGDCSPNIVNANAEVSIECFNQGNKTPLKTRIKYDVQGKIYEEIIIASVDGVTYVAYQPEVGVTNVVKQVDFNNDGYEDLLYSWSTGGNCCAPKYAILLYLGNGVFKNLEHDELWSWQSAEVVPHGVTYRLRVDSVIIGNGKTDNKSKMTVFEVVDGALRVVESAVGDAFVPANVQLTVDDFEKHGIEKTDIMVLSFDADGDKRSDSLRCGWWERWGLLSCEIWLASGKVVGIQNSCTRIGFLSSTTDGFRDAVCGRDLIMKYSAKVARYE